MAKLVSPAQEIMDGAMFSDPYPYLADDAELWLVFLASAHTEDPELFWRLNYLRGAGTSLVYVGKKIKYRLEPIIGDRGWESQEQYDKEKQCLNDYVDVLVKLLNDLPNP